MWFTLLLIFFKMFPEADGQGPGGHGAERVGGGGFFSNLYSKNDSPSAQTTCFPIM